MTTNIVAEIVIAIITGGLAVLGAYLGNVAVSRKKDQEQAIKDAERDTRLEVKLESLTKKIEEHNRYGQKIGQIQLDISAIQKDIQYLKKGK